MSLAATTGVHTGMDVAKVLMAGADVAMMTSALLRHGAAQVAAVEAALQSWGSERCYGSLAHFRGSATLRHAQDPAVLARANHVEGLIAADARVGGGLRNG